MAVYEWEINDQNAKFAEQLAQTDSRPLIIIMAPHGTRCRGAEVLTELRDAGRINGYHSIPPTIGDVGQCHRACDNLMLDLAVAGKVEGWTWFKIRGLKIGPVRRTKHSWLEFDGWAFDVGRGSVILAVEALVYRRSLRGRRPKVWITGAQFIADSRLLGKDPRAYAADILAKYQTARLAEDIGAPPQDLPEMKGFSAISGYTTPWPAKAGGD